MKGKRKGTICSIYLTLTDQVTQEVMRNLLEQISVPMILLGDFNVHNPLWGNEKKMSIARSDQ